MALYAFLPEPTLNLVKAFHEPSPNPSDVSLSSDLLYAAVNDNPDNFVLALIPIIEALSVLSSEPICCIASLVLPNLYSPFEYVNFKLPESILIWAYCPINVKYQLIYF